MKSKQPEQQYTAQKRVGGPKRTPLSPIYALENEIEAIGESKAMADAKWSRSKYMLAAAIACKNLTAEQIEGVLAGKLRIGAVDLGTPRQRKAS
jgi:hypothetical protein